jgi:cell division protein FtsI (penicillin-binding protein 3)
MRLNAEIGTAKQADVKGYYIGGKTGTSKRSSTAVIRRSRC